MSLTYNEIVERLLEHYDIMDIVELLKISAEDLIDRFEDRVEMYFDKLEEEVNDEEED